MIWTWTECLWRYGSLTFSMAAFWAFMENQGHFVGLFCLSFPKSVGWKTPQNLEQGIVEANVNRFVTSASVCEKGCI